MRTASSPERCVMAWHVVTCHGTEVTVMQYSTLQH
uniref:Uncharacterized protein n=1 Tax=Anguilla anguilla TaxID=7936 RepID=A0A0E9RU11_ANGAN